MKKLVKGILEFRKKVLPSYRQTFSHLALEQKPDALFVACSDSRVVPNLFASTDPGDLFVVRNVGNLVPACDSQRPDKPQGSAAAALEFSVERLKVRNVIVCGHSECGAMEALLHGSHVKGLPHLQDWLRHGDATVKKFKKTVMTDPKLSEVNRLSQLNVLMQLEHIQSYPFVRRKVESGELMLHGWWFDITQADVYAFEPEEDRFVLVEEGEAERIIARIEQRRGSTR